MEYGRIYTTKTLLRILSCRHQSWRVHKAVRELNFLHLQMLPDLMYHTHDLLLSAFSFSTSLMNFCIASFSCSVSSLLSSRFGYMPQAEAD